MTTTGEALAASQEVTLVIEQFLNENYRFRRNVLNGKVEFAILPKWDGQNHIARIFGRAQEDRTRFASFVATTNNRHPLKDATGSRRYICILIPDGQLIDNTGEMKERYGRDYFHLSHAETPLHKGDSSDYGRDERFF